ncbi:MAG: sulfite exporter TauE/SafE family protein [Planctomycetes bacterium]|nr:sulfite exporter TauE/SafE family protein [Planctomycetota bacterium]
MVTGIAAVVTFVFTTALTIAGVGAAFILIPVFDAIGIPIREAMSTALLLNCLAMIFASSRYIRRRLVVFRTALPILVVATALSPLGAYTAQYVPETPLRWLFVAFLLFAAVMMLFYRAKLKEGAERASALRLLVYGIVVGSVAGYVGGLLGVGGGNIIVPALVWLGFDPKKASATTAFIVIFSSFSGFLGHAALGQVNWLLLGGTAIGSVGGAILGAYLMTEKLNRSQVKLTIGLILLGIAAKMIFGLV